MANIFKDSYDLTKNYIKVVFQQGGLPILDFEDNEAQDILRGLIQGIASELLGGAKIVGTGARMVPGGVARAVSFPAGWAMDAGKLLRIPATTNLAVFGGGTVTGTASSLVYVEYKDTEITAAQDASIQEATFGPSALRIKREVQVLVNIGSLSLPTPTAGWTAFALGSVTHNFDTNGTTLLQSDISQDYGLSAGELAGLGTQRPLRLKANNLATETAVIVQFLTALSTGKAFELKDQTGAVLLSLDKTGKLVFPGGMELSAGSIVLTQAGATVDGVDLSAFKTAYDSHTHDSRYYTETEVDSLLGGKSGTSHNHDGTYAKLAGGAAFTGVVTHGANLITKSGITAAITTPAFVDMTAVAKRALVVFLSVDPGAYTGTYDVLVYANNDVGTELLASYSDQTGAMSDRVPWYFENARGDEKLYVRINKDAETGTPHTFTLGLKAEKFA